MMQPRIYIAGPMRGYPEHNVPAFDAAAARFRAAGWRVVSPVEVSEALGAGLQPEAYVAEDIKLLVGCRAIALLPGWEASTGARCEATVALTLGHAFYDAITGLEMERPERIHVCGGYEREPGEAESLDALMPEIRAFQISTFPKATPSSIAEHLRREAEELVRNPADLEEMADIFTLLVGAAGSRDLAAAVRAKLRKNLQRKWGQPDADGVVEHVAEATT